MIIMIIMIIIIIIRGGLGGNLFILNTHFWS